MTQSVYTNPTTMRIIHTGTRPLNIVLLGNQYYNTSHSYTGGGTVNAVGNWRAGTGVNPADNYTAQTLTDIAVAFDDLQRLGNLDLELNYPFVSRNTRDIGNVVTMVTTGSASYNNGTVISILHHSKVHVTLCV